MAHDDGQTDSQRIVRQQGDADARVRFSMSPDGRKLGVNRYFQPSGSGKPLSVDSIHAQLQAAGVRVDPEPGAAKRIIDAIEAGEDFTRIVLARAQPAQEARDGGLSKVGDPAYPVLPDQPFAIRTTAQKPKPGKALDGKTLLPKKTRKVSDVQVGKPVNCRLDAASGRFLSDVYGLASLEGNIPRVEPLARISEDELSVVATIHHRDNQGRPITTDTFQDILNRFGVGVKLRQKAVAKALEEAAKTLRPVRDVVIAKGKAPVDGIDGSLEYLVAVAGNVGSEREDGRLDYRERGTIPAVTAGTDVLRVVPPQPGQGGIDIWGKTVPPREGRPVSARAGDGVEALEDNSLFRATADGLLVVKQGVVSVTDTVLVDRDVDLGSGNVRAETGSVKVRGMVCAGLAVSAPKHVVVDKVIEAAEVTAGGDVDVGGGITMGDGGLVKAGGNVTAQYALNARIEADGNVTINNEVSNCRIRTRRRLTCMQGQGLIQGGRLECEEGLECKELGSELGVKTVVVAGGSKEENVALAEDRRAAKAQLDKIAKALGGADPVQLLSRVPEEKRPMLAKVIKHRETLKKRLADIDRRIAEEEQRREQELARAKVVVHTTIHPGVVVTIAGRTLRVDKPMDRTTVYWDPASREITTGQI